MSELPRRAIHLPLCGAFTAMSLLASCSGDGARSADGEVAALLALAGPPKIERVSVAGPGCADADASTIRIAQLGDTFGIDFEDFVASARDAARPRGTECTVSVSLAGEAGVAYAPAGLDVELDTSARSTLFTSGYWTSNALVRSEDVTTSSGGRYLTGALDDPTLWSACSGTRELRFTLKLGLEEPTGRAEVVRLSGLHFYARVCADAGPSGADAALPNHTAADAGSIDAQGIDASTDDAATSGSDAGRADAGEPAPPSPLSFTSVRATGTACPGNSAAIHIAEGRDTFDVDFSRFSSEAAAERGMPILYCILSTDILVPAGKTFALEGFTVRGSATLPAGTTARVSATPSFAGLLRSGPAPALALAGPREGSFELAANFADAELSFRPCGEPRTLSINVSLIAPASKAGAPARASVDRIDGFRFRIQDCP